jgi:hypothetical protein
MTTLDRIRELDRTAGTHGRVAGPVVCTLIVLETLYAAAHSHWHPFIVMVGVVAFVGVLGTGIRWLGIRVVLLVLGGLLVLCWRFGW